MRLLVSLVSLAQLCLATPVSLEERQAYGLVGDGFEQATMILGGYYNYWRITGDVYDLTRSDRSPTTSPKVLSMMGDRSSIKIEPNRTALVIIDMQNFFLHPDLSPAATRGRAAIEPTVNMINGFRKHGMKILWTNWGLTEYDLLTIPPSFKAGFSTGGSNLANETFGSDMGTIKENGTTIEVGRMLMRGSWNAEPYGVLGTMKDEGLKAGTDLWFNKNRLSGLWGPQTPLGTWLQENEVSTLFFGGVNADQCVWSTLVDAYFKGKKSRYVLMHL
jgi:nicotinamidase-related amidase